MAKVSILHRRALVATVLLAIAFGAFLKIRPGGYVQEEAIAVQIAVSFVTIIVGLWPLLSRWRRIDTLEMPVLLAVLWSLIGTASTLRSEGLQLCVWGAAIAVVFAWQQVIAERLLRKAAFKSTDFVPVAGIPEVHGGAKAATVSAWVFLAAALAACAGWLAAKDGATFRSVNLNLSVMSVLVAFSPRIFTWAASASLLGARRVMDRRGIATQGEENIPLFARVRIVVFNRSWAVTTGTLEVLEVSPGEDAGKEVLRAAASLGEQILHPFAEALRTYVPRQIRDWPLAEEPNVDLEGGAVATVEGRLVQVGTRRWLDGRGVNTKPLDQAWYEYGQQGRQTMGVAQDGVAIGVIAYGEQIRPEIVRAIKVLRRMRLRAVLLTGAAREPVQVQAQQAGFSEIISEVQERDKPERVRRLRKETIGAVVAVAHAKGPKGLLSAAQAPVLLGLGERALPEEMSAGIESESALDFVTLLLVARQAMQIITQNYVFAVVYHVVMLPLAAFGLVHPVVAMLLSAAVGLLPLFRAKNLLAFDPEVAAAWHLKK